MNCLWMTLLSAGICTAAAKQPNMVVVVVDDHACKAISAYGSLLKDCAKTPAIDRLFHEGMRFDNMTVPNSICSPSRAAIQTGQFSHKNGVFDLSGTINANSPRCAGHDLMQ